MATMVLGMNCQVHELQVAEEKAIRAAAGLTFSQKMSTVVRLVFSVVHLTSAFRDVVTEQAKMIKMLQRPEVQALGDEQYTDLAARIEKLVELNAQMIPNARSVGFPRWESILVEMEDQSEHLAGIAETFRTACDDEELAILAEMANTVGADCCVTTGEPVGSMHS